MGQLTDTLKRKTLLHLLIPPSTLCNGFLDASVLTDMISALMGKLNGPEDYLFDSLQTLYDIQPVMLTTSGTATFTYVLKSHVVAEPGTPERADCSSDISIEVNTPDTTPANWGLHASAIWVSSTHLADHLEQLKLENHMRIKRESATASDHVVRVIELGASAGLPSISIAKLYSACNDIQVIATDYEDDLLMKTLSENISRNGVAHRCRSLPYSWGTDPSFLLEGEADGFDVVIATDTLWNPELHGIFIDSLRLTLRKCCDSRIHLIVGLHTGRYTIQSFLDKVLESGFDLESIVERQTTGSATRDWVVYRDEEGEKERRRWVIWIQLKWTDNSNEHDSGIGHS